MPTWQKFLRFDPLKPLLGSSDEGIRYFARRDLLNEPVPPLTTIWMLDQSQRILKKQQPPGYWQYPGQGEAYYPVETFKQVRFLIEQYQLDRTHPGLEKACEFLFSKQTPEGDIRGIMGNQLAAYYSGAVLALLIKAGYSEDPRVEKGLRWLLSVRQNDGGWVELPGMLGLKGLTVNAKNWLVSDRSAETAREFEKNRPFSILATGMAIRPFCLSPKHRNSPETRQAAALLKGSFFKKNNYTTYQHPDNWTRFQFPFWWNNLVSALDSLSLAGLSAGDADIQKGLNWLTEHQMPDGLWKSAYSSIHKSSLNSRSNSEQLWISLAICRIFRRFSGV